MKMYKIRWIKKIIRVFNMNQVNREIKRLYGKNGDFLLDFPNIIGIETINKCNNVCSFCSASKQNDIRKLEIMDNKLFEKIINELIETDGKRKISFHINNEPLLDNRICDFIEYARKKLDNKTNIKLSLYTNGILLTREIFLRLAESLDELVIDNYNDKLRLIKPVKAIYKEYKNHSLKAKITIRVRKINEVLFNRAGNAPNRKNVEQNLIKNACILPYTQLNIRPDGKVSLCCNDVYGQFTLGDLRKNNIKMVWNGNAYNKIRQKMKSGRNNIMLLCNKCDYLYTNLKKIKIKKIV
jgi:radical SAM protein with 4Fe4S-binding SPASM domain